MIESFTILLFPDYKAFVSQYAFVFYSPGELSIIPWLLIKMASESLFRLGIVSSLLASIIMILVVVALYQLLKPVNKNMAALMVIFVLIAVPIAMLNELNQLGVLLLLSLPEQNQWSRLVLNLRNTPHSGNVF
jgi:hypothetical protein